MPRVTKQATIEAQAQEIEALQAKLAQAEQTQAQEQAYIKALAKLDLEKKDVQAELAQAYEQGEKEYQAIRLELVQAQNKYTQAQAELKALKQELAYYKLEQAWNSGVAFLGSTITKLCKLRKKYNPPTPEKQGQGKALEQELAIILDSID